MKKRGKMSWANLAVTLNCGIGLVAILPEKSALRAMQIAKKNKIKAFPLGRLVKEKSSKGWDMSFDKWERQFERSQ